MLICLLHFFCGELPYLIHFERDSALHFGPWDNNVSQSMVCYNLMNIVFLVVREIIIYFRIRGSLA